MSMQDIKTQNFVIDPYYNIGKIIGSEFVNGMSADIEIEVRFSSSKIEHYRENTSSFDELIFVEGFQYGVDGDFIDLNTFIKQYTNQKIIPQVDDDVFGKMETGRYLISIESLVEEEEYERLITLGDYFFTKRNNIIIITNHFLNIQYQNDKFFK